MDYESSESSGDLCVNCQPKEERSSKKNNAHIQDYKSMDHGIRLRPIYYISYSINLSTGSLSI